MYIFIYNISFFENTMKNLTVRIRKFRNAEKNVHIDEGSDPFRSQIKHRKKFGSRDKHTRCLLISSLVLNAKSFFFFYTMRNNKNETKLPLHVSVFAILICAKIGFSSRRVVLSLIHE